MTAPFAASMQALDTLIADQRAKAAAAAELAGVVLHFDGLVWVAWDKATEDDEFVTKGFGQTVEEAIADLRDQDDLGPDLTPEQIAAENARIKAEDDWIAPGGWDDEDDQPDEAQEWADFDRDC